MKYLRVLLPLAVVAISCGAVLGAEKYLDCKFKNGKPVKGLSMFQCKE